MKIRELYILLAILAFLGAGILVRNAQKSPQLAVEEFTALDLSFDPDKVRRIILSEGGGQVELQRGDAGWKTELFGEVKVSGEKVENFLNGIRNAKGEQRGSGKEILSDFGISDDLALHISLYPSSGNALLEILLGTKSAGDGHVFLRRKDSVTVYRAEADLFALMGIEGGASTVKPSKEFWAATQFMSVNTGRVRGITISKFDKGRETVLADVSGSGTEWTFKQPGMPFPVSPQRVSRLLEAMNTWQADKLLDPAAKDYGFSNPFWQMKVKFEDGTEKVYKAGGRDKETEAVYMQASGDPAVFQFSKSNFGELDITDTYFIGNNPLGVDSDSVERLVVRTGKEEIILNPAEKKWEMLEGYLNDMKTIRFTRVLADMKNFKPGPQSLEVTVRGKAPVMLEIGNFMEAEKEYAVRVRGTQTPVALSEQIYKWLFENLYRLKESKPEKSAQ